MAKKDEGFKGTISNLFGSLNKAIHAVNRTINIVDAGLHTMEAHAENFRDEELAELKANESDALKIWREEQAKLENNGKAA